MLICKGEGNVCRVNSVGSKSELGRPLLERMGRETSGSWSLGHSDCSSPHQNISKEHHFQNEHTETAGLGESSQAERETC